MTYERADRAFANAADADPACALAFWGRAMTRIHPLWSDAPTAEAFRRGEQFVQEATRLKPSTPEERAYIAAVEGYYREGRSATETANLAAFADGWERAHEQHPDDLEAASFHALGLLATADPRDKSFARQTRAAAVAADIRSRVPQHPGAHHYIIHAFDYPPLADQALEVAHHYSDIAPDVPHALHMPTHIFTRLGLWQDSIAWNERAAAAALKQPVDGAISLHYLHALDYLAYAHLQLKEDEKAQEVLRKLEAIDQPMQVELATSYTLAAVPARLALERQQWARAASLEPRVPESYPWQRFPEVEAITWFARALGAARSGDIAAAEAAVEKLAALREAAAETSTYWATQVDIQRTAASAWLAHAKGDAAQALELMQKAAELEASTEKHPVTPGEVLPAAELLGDLLMELGRFAQARAAYEQSLARSPNRYNSLAGAARAAQREGNSVAAE
jgi:tetratricopeptide (TPR) repeat protein